MLIQTSPLSSLVQECCRSPAAAAAAKAAAYVCVPTTDSDDVLFRPTPILRVPTSTTNNGARRSTLCQIVRAPPLRPLPTLSNLGPFNPEGLCVHVWTMCVCFLCLCVCACVCAYTSVCASGLYSCMYTCVCKYILQTWPFLFTNRLT